MVIHGPNVNRLIIHKASMNAVPAGGGIHAALSFLLNGEKRKAGFASAEKWVMEAIAVVKTAPDNPYKTDEEIAGAILAKIKERKSLK